MIYIDNQGGSGHAGAEAASLEFTLKPILDDMAIPNQMTRLKYGDAMMIGQSTEGPMRVGVEIKKVDEFLTSIYTHRLTGHQLPGMFRVYGRVHLIIEGQWRRGEDGKVELATKWGSWTQPHGGSHDWKAVTGFLLTLQVEGGVIVHYTRDRDETAAQLGSILAWSRKAKHSSLNVHYTPSKKFTKPSDATRFAEATEGVSFARGGNVVAAFRSGIGMAAATLKEWQKVLGPKVGETAYNSWRREG